MTKKDLSWACTTASRAARLEVSESAAVKY